MPQPSERPLKRGGSGVPGEPVSQPPRSVPCGPEPPTRRQRQKPADVIWGFSACREGSEGTLGCAWRRGAPTCVWQWLCLRNYRVTGR